MLQNRVDPQGNIISTSARGLWMGNRGQLHNGGKKILRPFKLKAWITCLLKFKNWHREVMSPNLYTELFFMDEATAFAAGHRPCRECRRDDFNKFKSAWLKGNAEYDFTEKTSIKEIDGIMHRERINNDKHKVTYRDKITDLPNGTFILFDDEPNLILDGMMYKWSAFGYDAGVAIPDGETVTVLTPKCTVNTFCAGYVPQVAI